MKAYLRESSLGLTAVVQLVTIGLATGAHAQAVERRVIDADFPAAYQVEVADVDGDRKPDIIAVGGGTCAWYQNPTWTKRVVTGPDRTPGVISSATADLDGDGRAEIAIAYDFEMNEPKRGKLLLASQPGSQGLDQPWDVVQVAEVGSIHRLRWGDINGDRKPDLVVAPIFGAAAKPPRYDEEGAAISIFTPAREGDRLSWTITRLDVSMPVLHAIDVIDRDGDGVSEIYTASNLGVMAMALKPPGERFASASLALGHQGDPPRRGASEIHSGRLGERRFLATVEPWHGSEVVIYPEPKGDAPPAGVRDVIDTTLDDGHALWVADVNGDGDDEVFAGHRGKDHRVSIYKLDRNSGKWTRTVLDREIAAQDLRGGDLDGDGTPDVVAVGGSTHNVVWYRFHRP